MAIAHKIPVEFARSIQRKIDVVVDKMIDYEFTDIRPIRLRHTNGSVQAETLIAVGITIVLLIIIAVAVMLSLNG